MGEDEDEVYGVDHWEFGPVNGNECDFAVIQNCIRDYDLKHIQWAIECIIYIQNDVERIFKFEQLLNYTIAWNIAIW